MEMVFLLGLCILTVAFINQQHESMRRMMAARVRRDERRDV